MVPNQLEYFCFHAKANSFALPFYTDGRLGQPISSPRLPSIREKPSGSSSVPPPAAATISGRATRRALSGKYIPGNPEVVPQNMPGAGGTVAANYVYGIAKPDGLTLGAFNPALYFDQLSAAPKSNSTGQSLPGSVHRNRTTFCIIFGRMLRLRPSTICATPKSRPAAAAREPALPATTFRDSSRKRWASKPLS